MILSLGGRFTFSLEDARVRSSPREMRERTAGLGMLGALGMWLGPGWGRL